MHWILSLKTPTPEEIERVLARLGQPGANAYFFDRLNNPEWVKPLYEHRFFTRPPEAERSVDDGSVSLPDWPEMRFLLRMAPIVPQIVGKIVVDIPDTDNGRVRELLIEAGEHLDRRDSEKLANRVVGWLEDPLTLRHFAKPVAPLIVHLLQLGCPEPALRLMRRLFATKEPDAPQRLSKLDEWHYERYLSVCLPALRSHAPLETLALLRDFLLDEKREPAEGQTDDYSYIWRRDLLHSNYTVKQIPDILIDALRDSALELAKRNDVGFGAVRDTLIARGERAILVRIAIFVAAELGDWSHHFVLETLLNTRLVDRFTYRAEYARLLQAAFPNLAEPARSSVMVAIQSDLLQNISPTRRAQLSESDLQMWARVVMRDRLTAFGPTLPRDLVTTREILINELGEAPTPHASAVWHGPTSPVQLESLGEMTLGELVEYLASWIPTRGFGAPGREGLGRLLQQLVKNRAAEWSASALDFARLHPTYVRAIFLGLNDACSAKAAVTWPPIVALMKWVLSQPREAIDSANAFEDGEDPDWTWTRQAIARLMTTAFMTAEADLQWDLRDHLWGILKELLQDPDPPPEVDREDNDPITTAINRVRGVAAHALFRFAWWIHNHLPATDALLTFERMPEVRTGLDIVLADPSPAIHSVLGDWFRTMFFFDSNWTTTNLEAIFPGDPVLIARWQAAWRSFADYDQPYDPAFFVLLPKYELALARLQGGLEEQREKMGETGLGQHFIRYYWRGVGGERSEQLLLRYFDICSAPSAAHVLWSAGSGLQAEEPIAPATIGALMHLWTEITARAASWGELKQREIYRQFGAWFVSGRFDNLWSLQQLEKAVQITGILDLEKVLERMAPLSTDYPQEVAKILELIVRDERDIWQPLLWQRQVEAILQALLDSTREGVRDYAISIINQIVQRGGLFVRHLLRSGETGTHTGSP
jgi:hypothetical protein